MSPNREEIAQSITNWTDLVHQRTEAMDCTDPLVELLKPLLALEASTRPTAKDSLIQGISLGLFVREERDGKQCIQSVEAEKTKAAAKKPDEESYAGLWFHEQTKKEQVLVTKTVQQPEQLWVYLETYSSTYEKHTMPTMG
jgi:hypothetical protein